MFKKIKNIAVLLVVFLIVSSAAPTHLLSENYLVGSYEPVYTVDLDLPHLERWKQIMADKGQIVHDFSERFCKDINLPQETMESFVTYGEAFPEYAANIKAIAQLANIDLATLYTFNFMYDLQVMGCTSVIIRQTDGSLFHARNLDYNYQAEIAAIAIDINWFKDGKLFYKSETLAGFVSLITATKPGQFSVSINYRHNQNVTVSLEALLQKHFVQAIYLPQIAVNTANSFSEAVEIFKTVDVSSPIYYIVSGLSGNEGVVIERDRERVNNMYWLSDEDWFLVQTNTDRDDPRYKDYRYFQTIKSIQNLGQANCTKETVLDNVMSVFPMKNSETISTTIYSAYNGELFSWNYLNEQQAQQA